VDKLFESPLGLTVHQVATLPADNLCVSRSLFSPHSSN